MPISFYDNFTDTYTYNTASSATTWHHWVIDTSTSTTNAVWSNWTIDFRTAGNVIPVPEPYRAVSPQDEAEIARRRAEAEASIRRQREEAEEARTRAEALLREVLAPAQVASLEAHGHFELETIAQSGQRRRYRINRGVSRNIVRLDDAGRAIIQYCVHGNENMPDADHMVAQKLLLETNEEEFLRLANATRLAA